MPRKEPFQADEERRQVKWYQWEFLRRNPEYRREFQGFMDRFGSWFQQRGFWYERVEYKGEDEQYFFKVISSCDEEIRRKWDISWLCPPDWSFPKFGSYFDKSCGYEYKPGEYAYLPTGSHPARFTELSEEERRLRFIDIRVDVTRPLDGALAQVRDRVKMGRELYEERFGEKKHKRRRLDHYDVYLRVWDLRQERKPFRKIAEILYPEDYAQQAEAETPPDCSKDSDEQWEQKVKELTEKMGEREAYAKLDKDLGLDQEPSAVLAVVQRVRDHYCRARFLIEGGYKEIR